MNNTISILKVTSNIILAKKILKAIGEEYIYHTASDFESTIEYLEKEKIDFIYLDLDALTSNLEKTIEIIKTNKETAKNPIFILTSDTSNEFREKMFNLGVSDVLIKPFFEKEIRESFLRVYGDSGKFKSSFTTKLVDSTVQLFNSEELAYLMENRGKIYCREKAIDIQTSKDIATLAKYLSIAIKGMELEKLKTYFSNLDLAMQLQKILFSSPSEDKNSAILYALFEQEMIFHDLQDSALLDYGENRVIYDELFNKYNREIFNIFDFLDYKYINSILKDRLTKELESSDTSLEVIKILERVVKYTLLYSGGSKLKYSATCNPTIEIYPQNNKILMTSEKLKEALGAKDESIFVTREFSGGKYFYKIEVLKKAQEEKKDVLEERVVEAILSSELTKEETIDAVTYLESNTVDYEDISVMEECEFEVSEILDVVEYSDAPSKYILMAYDIIHKYSNRLIYYIEFKDISDSLSMLAETLRQEATKDIDSTRILNAFTIIESIIRNLKNWRMSIFIDQNAEDIHFLDSSIKADCQQLVFFLAPDSEDEVEDALEFF